MSDQPKYVYSFGGGKADGKADMKTLLGGKGANLALTDASVEGVAKKTCNPRFAYDGYRRVLDMFGSTAMGVDHEHFEHELHTLKQEKGVKLDTELTADDLKELVRRYKAVYKAH